VIDPDDVPPLDVDEVVARYILQSGDFRKGDNTVKPKLFLPYKYMDLSVNRHRDCTDTEIWGFGTEVAKQRSKTLYGRSDISVSDCHSVVPLKVVSKPIKAEPNRPANPNHADITGYPATKEDQMALAQKLAALAGDRQELV